MKRRSSVVGDRGRAANLGGLVPILLLAACASPPATAPEPARPTPAHAAGHSPSATALPGLREKIARFAGLDNVARGDTLLRIFRELGFEPEVQTFANPAPEEDARAEGRNLIVTLGEGERDIVVGAHYDAVSRNGQPVGGVVDNGAASVILTRVAETLRGRDLRHRVRVVLFDLEESGLLGSAAYAAAGGAARTAAMVNVDVAAYGDALAYGPGRHQGNAAVYRAFEVVCAERAYTCIEFPVYPPSDDRSFQAAGVPNISIASLDAAEAHQMWLMLNGGPEAGLREGFVPPVFGIIHTPADTLEKAEAEAMARVHDAVVALVLELDETLP